MKKLEGVSLDSIPITGFKWEMDLYGHDGPLLSQFKSDAGKKYLYSWCDCNVDIDRWMIFSISEADRVRLLIGKKTLRDVVITAKQDFVFFLDINNQNETSTYYLVEGEKVPESYIPEENSFIDVDNPKVVLDNDQVSLLFEKSWEIETIRDFVRNYRQAYDFTIGLSRNLIGSIINLPWQGGFSAMHFFEKLNNRVSSEERLTTGMMQFTSPGILKLNVNDEAANSLLETIDHYERNKKTIDSSYNELSASIRNEKLNRIDPGDAQKLFQSNNDLIELFNEFVAVLGYEEQKGIVLNNRSAFETAKIFMAQYKRIKTIHEDLTDGMVSMAKWEIGRQKQ